MAEPSNQTQTVGNNKAAWNKALSSGDFETLQNILVATFERQVENNHGIAREFVIPNVGTLTTEINAYGLDNINPFFTFLKKYNQINGSTQVFWDPSKYNVLHNLVAKDIIDVTQMRDTCTDERRADILWNKTLWDNSPDDITWLVNTYLWFMNVSAWEGLKVSDNFLVKALKQRNDNDINTRYVLRSLCFFSTDIQKFIGKYKAGDLVHNSDDLTREFAQIYYKLAAGKTDAVHTPINSPDTVEYQIKLLDELVNKNGANATNYRETDAQKKATAQKVNKDKIKRGEEVAEKNQLDIKTIKDKIGNTSDLLAYSAYIQNEIRQ